MSLIDDIKSLFPDARIENGYARCRCPFHKGGNERRPSMSIITREGHNGMTEGTVRCFTCGWKGSFADLAEAFGMSYVPDPELVATKSALRPEPKVITSQRVLKKDVPWQFSPYLASRGIPEEIQKQFRVFEKPEEQKVYLPVFDRQGYYLYVNARSTSDVKAFFVESNAKKSLAYVEELDFSKPIAIVESQINAMTLYASHFCRAVATLGATNLTSLNSIKKAPGPFLLMFDGDEAGSKATQQAKHMLGAYRCIVFNFPHKKDVNDIWQECHFDEELFAQTIESFKE